MSSLLLVENVVVIVLGKDALLLGGVRKQPRVHPGGASSITSFNQSEASSYSPVKEIVIKASVSGDQSEASSYSPGKKNLEGPVSL